MSTTNCQFCGSTNIDKVHDTGMWHCMDCDGVGELEFDNG